MKKIKVMTISDYPLSPSGVAHQTKNMILALLKTGRYQVVSIGGAMKHNDYTPKKSEEFPEDWILHPVDGYGTEDYIRSMISAEKPDILWFMTDPRFWTWLWAMEHEVRSAIPMVYYHVWDNFPVPDFNKSYYESNDKIVTISKLTHQCVLNAAPNVECEYLPHAVDDVIFAPMDQDEIQALREQSWPEDAHNEKVLFFWNNRNARRKQSGTVVWWFNDFLNEVGRDKARLILHTEPKDPNGQDLIAILEKLNCQQGEIQISTEKLSQTNLAGLYNMADCTINVADAEGFGLSTLESLSCETPIIVNMTGGLQEQITDGENWFGVGIEPSSKTIIGSQDVPYIYEDRISKEDFIAALKKILYMTKEERKTLGVKGRAHVQKNYNFETYQERWIQIFDEIYEKHGSWTNRKNYTPWSCKEI